MAQHFISKFTFSIVVLLASLIFIPISCSRVSTSPLKTYSDVDLIESALNLEYMEAEFFLYGALGHGLDEVAPELAEGGPPPIGAKLAILGPLVQDIIFQFGMQEVGHIRAIKKTVRGFPRPLLDLSKSSFAKVMDSAFGQPLHPPFDPYANEINFLIASYVIPYVGLTGYVGANPQLQNATSRKLVAGLLGVESGQDAVLRALLYERRAWKVHPYGVSVAEFTNRISWLRNKLGKEGIKDEGLEVKSSYPGNILAGDEYSLSYPRTPEEILRIVYGSANESIPGGFYPHGANGHIARSYLQST